MGRFFNGKVKNDKSTLIRYGVIAGGVLLIIIIIILIAVNSHGSKGTLTLNKVTEVEVNTELPDKTKFFKEIVNFDKNDIEIDYNDADISTVGSYTVTLSAKGSEDVELKVVDTTAPTLTLKEYTVGYGDPYFVEDFVSSCTDNYDKECTVEFFRESSDSNGNAIDYSSYTELGTYSIMIVAKDENGNVSEPQTTSLIIQEDATVSPTNCEFGNLDVSSDLSYPIAVTVGDKETSCAINRDLWDNEDVKSAVDKFYNEDYERLKTQLTPVLEEEYPDKDAKISVYPHYVAILNKSLKGLVGYAVYVKVYIAPTDYEGSIDSTENLKMAYYLNSDKTREYDVNVFDIAK